MESQNVTNALKRNTRSNMSKQYTCQMNGGGIDFYWFLESKHDENPICVENIRKNNLHKAIASITELYFNQ